MSLEQVAQVVAAQSRLRDRLLFVLLFTTGMRIGQALGLRHEDVRLWKRELAIVPRDDNANGARGKRGCGVVPLTEEAARLYLLYMEHEYGLLDSDYVFVNLWGGEPGRPLSYAAVSRLVARTRTRVGFDFTPPPGDRQPAPPTPLRVLRDPREEGPERAAAAAQRVQHQLRQFDPLQPVEVVEGHHR
jgi:integrase/recombinase XerD